MINKSLCKDNGMCQIVYNNDSKYSVNRVCRCETQSEINLMGFKLSQGEYAC